jgi:hypothetical protein
LKEVTTYTLLTLKSTTYFGSEWVLDEDVMKEASAILKCETMAVSMPRQKTLYCCDMTDALNPEITPNFIEFTKVFLVSYFLLLYRSSTLTFPFSRPSSNFFPANEIKIPKSAQHFSVAMNFELTSFS